MVTTHADKIAGWSIIGLFLSGLVSMTLASFAPHLSPSAQTTLLNIGLGCTAAVAGNLAPRLTGRTTPPEVTPDVH